VESKLPPLVERPDLEVREPFVGRRPLRTGSSKLSMPLRLQRPTKWFENDGWGWLLSLCAVAVHCQDCKFLPRAIVQLARHATALLVLRLIKPS
jgi:hypothetical protein